MFISVRMSFIPGEASEQAVVASVGGSGISITTINNVDYISTALVAGAGVAIVPSPINNTIEISATGGGGGISSVSANTGSGITTTTVGSAVSLSSNLVAGSNISLTPLSGTQLQINNTQTLTSATGSGITLTPSGNNTAISANIISGNGINIVSSGTPGNTTKTVINTGLLGLSSANAGSNITITGSPTAPIISATGGGSGAVSSVTGGTGISVSPTTGAVVVTNNGLLGLTSSNASGNITISGTPTAPIISSPLPRYGTVSMANTGVGFPANKSAPFGTTYHNITWSASMAYDFQNGVSDPHGGWIVFMNGWVLANPAESTQTSNDIMNFYLQDATDIALPAYPLSNSVIGQTYNLIGSYDRDYSCPTFWLPVNQIRTALPNIGNPSSSPRIIVTLSNTSSDVTAYYEVGVPQRCFAIYIPDIFYI